MATPNMHAWESSPPAPAAALGVRKMGFGRVGMAVWAIIEWFPSDISYRHRGGFPFPPRTPVPTCGAGGEDVQ